MQSQTKHKMFKVLDKYHQILLKEKMKAALGYIIEGNAITPLKSRINTTIKLQPPSNKSKIQEFLGMANFLSK